MDEEKYSVSTTIQKKIIFEDSCIYSETGERDSQSLMHSGAVVSAVTS